MRAFDEGNLRSAQQAVVEKQFVVSDNTDWQRLGFTKPPFEDDSEGRFFPIGSWESSFNEMAIFATDQDPLVVVPAITGSGKSSFLAQFIAQQSEGAQCHYLKARSIFSVRHLLNVLSENFIEFRSAGGNTEQFLSELRAVSREAGPQLLVIDDAQRLSKETLSSLFQILAGQDLSNLWLRVVLCGEPQLEDRVQSLFDELELAFTFPAITLDSMTLTETRGYLKHRLDEAGFSGNFPFSKSMVKHIHTLACGFPGRTNRVAQQVLIDGAKKQHSGRRGGSWSFAEFLHVHKIKWISLTVLLVAGWTVWHYQPLQRAQTKAPSKISSITDVQGGASIAGSSQIAGKAFINTPQSVHPIKLRTSPGDQPKGRDLSMSQQKMLSSNSGMRILLPSLKVHPQAMSTVPVTTPVAFKIPKQTHQEAGKSVSVRSMPRLVLTEHQKIGLSKPQSHSGTQPQLSHHLLLSKPDIKVSTSKSAVLVKPSIAQKISKPIAISKVTKRAGQSHGSTPAFGHGGYTVQLLGVHDKAKLDQFAARHHIGMKAAYFVSQFHAKPWYVLVYGRYDSSQAAHAAVKHLPFSLRQQHPWVKPVSTIHSSIHWLREHHQS